MAKMAESTLVIITKELTIAALEAKLIPNKDINDKTKDLGDFTVEFMNKVAKGLKEL